jgi:hypothetical protein
MQIGQTKKHHQIGSLPGRDGVLHPVFQEMIGLEETDDD